MTERATTPSASAASSDGERGAPDIGAVSRQAADGNRATGAEKLASQHKLFVRDRLALLLDEGSLVEDALLANALAGDLPADGVVTGRGMVEGRPVCVMANDTTVKAGSWGARTVEKIVRLTEYAMAHELPVFWLVDSAGARITDQVELFPGRRGAGRIFYNQVRLSGRVPQICCLFGPSAAGGAYNSSTSSPTEIVPSVRMSALMPARWTSSLMIPGRVIDSRCVHGSQSSTP